MKYDKNDAATKYIMDPITTSEAMSHVSLVIVCDEIEAIMRHGVVTLTSRADRYFEDPPGSMPVLFATKPAAIIANITITLINTSAIHLLYHNIANSGKIQIRCF